MDATGRNRQRAKANPFLSIRQKEGCPSFSYMLIYEGMQKKAKIEAKKLQSRHSARALVRAPQKAQCMKPELRTARSGVRQLKNVFFG